MSEGLETILQAWPEESREAAKLVIEQYGDPDEKTSAVDTPPPEAAGLQ